MPAYLTSPVQRLASSARLDSTRGSQRESPSTSAVSCTAAAESEDFKADMMNITEAILDLCNGHSVDKPSLVKDADHNDDENDDTTDDMDGDSGIDRSEDFAKEILNEM